ncbi:LytTR family DNA-binding domain-containing protein [Christensenella hongkongensis]|uniref:LytTR family DNA-binding domain-containing protein n=1 Tax=Christensenella hongkongensis TaxID=270498 RepID=UPI002673AFF7|nr:LytTR family DNA-binding domain-containing protein [Christensenella hongkongensis]
MRLKLEQDTTLDDIHILIQYAEKNEVLKRLIRAVKSCEEKMEAFDRERKLMLNVTDIYYFESVDKKTFACCREKVYYVADRLYQLKNNLAGYGFVQINKACLLNINVLSSMRSTLNSKMEATLANGERVNVSRKYIHEIKEALKGGYPNGSGVVQKLF